MTAGAASGSQAAGLLSAVTSGHIGKAQTPGSSHLPAFRRKRVELGQFPQSSMLPLVLVVAAQELLSEPGEVERMVSGAF